MTNIKQGNGRGVGGVSCGIGRAEYIDPQRKESSVWPTVPLPYRIVALQLWAALILAAALLFVGRDQALAALLAGVVCVLPAGYFAWRAERERSAARLLGHGVMKSMSTMALMALVFATLQPPPLGFFSAFVLLQLMYVVGPLGRRGR